MAKRMPDRVIENFVDDLMRTHMIAAMRSMGSDRLEIEYEDLKNKAVVAGLDLVDAWTTEDQPISRPLRGIIKDLINFVAREVAMDYRAGMIA